MYRAGLFLLALALAACGQLSIFFNPEPYRIRLEPTQLGYEVRGGTIEVVQNVAYVEVASGAPGGVLERYEYVVVGNDGQELFPDASFGSGVVGLPFPPGRQEENGQIVYRGTRSEGFTFSLDGRVAAEHYNRYLQGEVDLNWRVRVTWFARLEDGRNVSWKQEYQIKLPLREQ
ncbi:hypothetical protein Theos_0313 [Thermus oshimai JL-2]|uniref:Lipoprotein n=1 Tax=Thermus oshimai JL-2 TaxID=751945 RepID=K7R3C6_THEOS|nr:hypothetical protein [Thermus oshimai]AFV75389.1 hypothetical protein Theos_0313 [Thermus oshimai JL-2]